MIKNEVAEWQEAIASLPDKNFFYIMRLYLGEIKTPYNKQRLVSQLAGFIREPENIKSVLSLLTKFDLTILTAISALENPTPQILFDFFEGEFSQEQIFSGISNLSERLLIYKKSGSQNFKESVFINPLLKDDLSRLFNKKLLFPDYEVDFFSTDDFFELSPNFLAAFFSYVRNKGLSCKADGVLKKNDVARLSALFPKKEKAIQALTTAFINLSILKENSKDYEINFSRLDAFADLSEIFQYALICAASVSRFSAEGLRKEAQLLIDCFASIPENGFSRRNILRLVFFNKKNFKNSDFEKGSVGRFNRILQAAGQNSSIEILQNSKLLDRMLDSAAELGLLHKIGKTSSGIQIFTANSIFKNPDFQSRQNSDFSQNLKNDDFTSARKVRNFLSIDSTFTVTFLPGLDLKSLLEITKFMIIKKWDVATEFEITRQSCAFGFDNGVSPEKIFALLSEYSNYEIPKNLKINVSEWYETYKSAVLYCGYVLKTSEQNASLVEKNPKIRQFIREKLAPGVWFLEIPQNSDILTFIRQSGLEFLGKIKTSDVFPESANFPVLRTAQKIDLGDFPNEKDDFKENPERSENLQKTERESQNSQIKEKLLKILEKMPLDENIKTCLKYRVESQLILSEKQLKNTAVRTGILETSGADYSGKIHLIEAAIKDGDVMKIQLPNPEKNGEFLEFLGRPTEISKTEGDAIMRFVLEPSKESRNFFASKITNVKKIRF